MTKYRLDTGRGHLAKLASWCATAIILCITDAAFAQAPIEEIVVTARKRTENLQDVPLSISVISSTDLERASVYSLEDLAEMTPGFTYQTVGSTGQPTIRGLAQTQQGGLIGNVGVFLDGVYLNNRSSFQFGVLDLERIEIVKGPQGALYGRNTFAGAINYVTKEPSVDGFEGKLTAEIGSEDRREIGGSFNLPLGENAALRVFASTSEFEGTIDNVRPGGEDLGGYDERTAYGASLLFKPIDKLTVRLFAMRNELDEDQSPLSTIGFANNNCGTRYALPGGDVWTLFCGDLAGIGAVPNLDPLGGGQEGELTVAYINVDYELPFGTLTANYADTDTDYFTFFDNVSDPTAQNRPFFPGSPFSAQFFTNGGGDAGSQKSFEIRLTSDDEGPLQWLVGGSWFDTQTGTIINSFARLVADPSMIGRITRVAERQDEDILAVFGSLSYAFNDQHRATVELRHTEEDLFLIGSTEIDFIPGFPNSITQRGVDFSYTTPRLTYEYTWSDNVLVYASAARGIKSGGVNRRALTDEFATFDPEKNWTYEAGVKTTILDGRGTFNATVYYIDWEDLQNQAPASVSAAPVVINADAATSTGIELDGTLNITDNFVIRGALTVLNPEFDGDVTDASLRSICGGTASVPPAEACSDNVGGNQLPRTSDVQAYLGGTYTWPNLIGDFDGYVRLDTSHQAGKYSLSLNLVDQGDINLTNLRIGLLSDRYEFALWVENLFDEDYLDRVTVITDPEAGFICVGCGITRLFVYPGNSRTIGLRANVTF